MVLTEKEELILKKWITWQSEAAKCNAISDLMTDRIAELKLQGTVTDAVLKADSVFMALQVQHDNQAALCNQPLKDFKEEARK